MSFEAGRRPPMTAVERVETGFYLLVMAMMSEALLGPVFGATPPGVDPPAWLQLMWLPVYAVMTALLVLRAPLLGRVWIGGLLTAGLVLLAFASVSWSVAPDISLRRSVALLYTSLLGLMIAARYGWRGMIELFAATFLILGVGSLIASVAFPSFGVHADIHPGAWRGLWMEKNQLGAYMAKGVLACLSAAVLAPPRRGLWISGAVLCSALVLLSTSTTSLVAWLIVLGGGLAMAGFRRDGVVRVLTFGMTGVVGAVVLSLVLLAPDLLLGVVGKDATLTGRTDIWASLMRSVDERPWEGYGYAAFWADERGPAWFVRRDIGWNSPTAHNGWLDVLVQLGWVGLGVFVLHFAVSATAASRRLFSGGEGLWVVLSTVLFALFSVSESTIMQQNNLNWVLYVATTAKLLELRRSARAVAPQAYQVGRATAAGAAASSLRRTSAAP